MTDHGERLAHLARTIPEAEQDVRVAGALRDWVQLLARGPGEGPFANWTYLRSLARSVRSLTQFLQEQNRPRPL
ncbi:hypothetical protein GCM10010278_73940 [Streptomyces melanogenes]|nr:hypothetical protein GCM10010278_73940 [Streptomyces melanogenes]